MIILDGKALSLKVLEQVKERVAKLEKACIFAQTYLMQVLIW